MKNEYELANKKILNDMEQLYINGTVNNLIETIEEKKKEVVTQIVDYANEHYKANKWTRSGDILREDVEFNPIAVDKLFFKSIVPLNCKEPEYNPEQLSLIFDYYNFLIGKVNEEIGNFPPSIKGFCKFCGLTVNTFSRLRASSDISMRTVVEKIYDEIEDSNVTLSQLGFAKEKTTIFKMKTQNEVVEKVTPNVNVNVSTTITTDEKNSIDETIKKYSKFLGE